MEITQYKHKEYDFFKLMNKELFPQSSISWTDYEEFNEVYKWAKDNCMLGVKTRSGGIAGGPKNRYHNFYLINNKKASVELIICHTEYGCYKFVCKNKKSEDNCVGGKQALQTIYKTAKRFNVFDIFKDNAVDKDKGEEIKKEIESPMIYVTSEIYKGREFEHCYHIDANSSYASRISEAYPELKPMYEWLYKNRKENNDYFKHVLTNSIGAMQSQYCVDIDNRYMNTSSPYQLAIFAKTAINGTNKYIIDLLAKLYREGFEPLLINTDGIWYRSKDKTNRCYHDDNEGTELCQWKNDHNDVKLYIKSAGSYQFIEDGKVKTVLRGVTELDKVKPNREEWTWREIDNYPVKMLKFIEGEGIVEYE